jgi:hypothetical protein
MKNMKDATPIILAFNKNLTPTWQLNKFKAIQESPKTILRHGYAATYTWRILAASEGITGWYILT